jgi:hypothetical protein
MQSSQAAAFVVGLPIHDDNSVSGSVRHADTLHQQALPVVIPAIEDGSHLVPISWPVSNATQITKDHSDFLDSANTGMIWHNNDIGLNTSHIHQASILSSPIFFLSERIMNSGSLSAGGKLLVSAHRKESVNLFKKPSLREPNVNVQNNSSFIKDGRIDMDLILIISAGVSGLLLILIPERKRKRNIIRETNIALLRRPRQ